MTVLVRVTIYFLIEKQNEKLSQNYSKNPTLSGALLNTAVSQIRRGNRDDLGTVLMRGHNICFLTA